jgi:hypothetical protein
LPKSKKIREKMKKIFFALLCLVQLGALAQNGPVASPAAKNTQTIGTTEVTVEYSRPSLKGRELYGTLWPAGKRWRTGANAVTKFTTAKDIVVEGTTLKAGSYAIFTTPAKDSWQVHFFNYDQSYPPTYDAKTPNHTVTVKPAEMSEKVETFMIVFDSLKADGGEMGLIWGNVYVPIQISAK